MRAPSRDARRRAIPPRPRAALGARPRLLASADSEVLLAMIVALAAEVHRLEDRHDRLLAALARDGVKLPEEAGPASARAPRAEALVERVFRVFDEMAERALRGDDEPYPDVVDRLGRPEGP